MNFRWKMQILLLAIALVPLILISAIYHLSTHDLGAQLAANSQELLTEKASSFLQRLVIDYGRILNRDQQYLELTLKSQAREVERRLAVPPPSVPPAYIDGLEEQLSQFSRNMMTSNRHFKVDPGGQRSPMLVNLQEQVFFLAQGANRQAVATDLARLTPLTDTYQFLYLMNPGFLLWTYTGLESGLFSSFPGVTDIPRDFDPRQRPWYQKAQQQNALVWSPPYVDVFTRSVLLTLSMPVRRPDGSFAGVVGIDVAMAALFQELQLPETYARQAETYIVMKSPQEKGGYALRILAQKSYEDLQQPWQTPLELDLLTADNPTDLAELTRDAVEGRSGVLTLNHNGQRSLWAYGPAGPGEAFPVIIVPEKIIIAQAAQTRAEVLAMTTQVLQLVAVLLCVVVVAVTVLAFISSRSVTWPVLQISAAAIDLAGGNYRAQVQITSGDELQRLGKIFNEIGPKLQEREKMQHSLVLAREVQQHLLPHESPQLAGFEIFGNSKYCEETGGDYYDFIESAEIGATNFGIAVGDVCGHGIGAALIMASVRGVLHSQAGHNPDDLETLFHKLNLHLTRFSAADQFMTLFYGKLSAADRSLCWVSGGHGPCLRLHGASGRVEELATTGIPLGILETEIYQKAGPVTLEQGDILLIGTDGIWEAQNDSGEMFGIRRLTETLSACRKNSAPEIYAGIMEAVDVFRVAGPQADDITLVVVKSL